MGHAQPDAELPESVAARLGTALVLVDLTRGRYATDPRGTVTGIVGPSMPEELPSDFLIAYDDLWSVVHANASGMLGWLILQPHRPVDEPTELTDAEAARLGVWQVRLARALTAELGCPRTYVVRFGEVPGHRLHYHVVARSEELDEALRGPGIFAFLQPGQAERVSPDARRALAARLSARLAADETS